MLEMLSAWNRVVWANPYGSISGNLLPRVTRLKQNLSIYNPGVNFLPLPALGGLNERRRLLQVKLYLLEQDFEPDVVWLDSLSARPFAAYYRRKGALTLYYATEELDRAWSHEERRKLAEPIDMVVTPSKDLYEKYLRLPGSVHLLSGGDLEPPPEIESEQFADDLLEKEFMEKLEKRILEISELIEKELK